MDLRPGARWVTPCSWSTENRWSNMPFKIFPGVLIWIFFPRHPTPPLLSFTENPDWVRHRTAAPFLEQQVVLPSAYMPLVSQVSHVAVLPDTVGPPHACAVGSHHVYRHGAAVQSNAR